MAAERETTDRLIAAFLADRVGAEFDARISGVTRSGLFVRLRDTGADGFVPAATIGNDYFAITRTAHALVGDRTGEAYRLGDSVRVQLVEAIPIAGALRFEMLSDGKREGGSAQAACRKGRRFGAAGARGDHALMAPSIAGVALHPDGTAERLEPADGWSGTRPACGRARGYRGDARA